MKPIALALIVMVVLKIGWNFAVPYMLAWRQWQSADRRSGAISMTTFLEIGLLCALVAVTAMGGQLLSEWGPAKVATWGTILIVASYVHLAIVGILLGAIAARRRPNRLTRPAAGSVEEKKE
jgi:ABC-type Na+ efflux pump permease subunit